MEEKAPAQTEEVAVPASPTLKQLYDMRKRAQVAPQIIFQKCSAAFHAGEKAKRMGWSRTPIDYGEVSALQTAFFYDGYDGKTWTDAVQHLIGKSGPA